MSVLPLLDDEAAAPAARAVFDEIRAVRQSDYVNNFWRALAHDPGQLRATWDRIGQVMAPGALDPLTKELVYIAVSAANGCSYCIHSHTRCRQGERHDPRAACGTSGGNRHGQPDQCTGHSPSGRYRRPFQGMTSHVL